MQNICKLCSLYIVLRCLLRNCPLTVNASLCLNKCHANIKSLPSEEDTARVVRRRHQCVLSVSCHDIALVIGVGVVRGMKNKNLRAEFKSCKLSHIHTSDQFLIVSFEMLLLIPLRFSWMNRQEHHITGVLFIFLRGESQLVSRGFWRRQEQ